MAKAEQQFMVGDSRGRFIGNDGRTTDQAEQAETHDSELVARSFCRRRNESQMPRGQWRVIPVPAKAAVPDESDRYDPELANAEYKRLRTS